MSVFDALVGQARAVEQLQAAADAAARVVRGETAGTAAMTHAWLFTGPPGSGRSIAARAFAAALQCPDAGCGHCAQCAQAMGGTHADVAVVQTEGVHLLIEHAREVVAHASRLPTGGRWQVTLVEDADRMEERTSNTVLKIVEEPPAHSVLLLCAPTAEDLLPTIRSRCRVVGLATPAASAVTELLVAEGVDAPLASWAAQASQGHIGRARRLARDEGARRERHEALSLPRSLQTVGGAIAAADALVDAAKEESARLSAERDEQERAGLATALGAGATGKGLTGRTPRGGAGMLKELEKTQKRRGTRTQRDALDRALVDLAAFYRDVLVLQLAAGVPPVHPDAAEQAASIARATTAESTLRRIDAVLACRDALDANVDARLAVETMALALRAG